MKWLTPQSHKFTNRALTSFSNMLSYLKLTATSFFFAKDLLLVLDLCKISTFTAQCSCKTKATVWLKTKQYCSGRYHFYFTDGVNSTSKRGKISLKYRLFHSESLASYKLTQVIMRWPDSYQESSKGVLYPQAVPRYNYTWAQLQHNFFSAR